jgi:hypothetical protein
VFSGEGDLEHTHPSVSRLPEPFRRVYPAPPG